MAEKDVEKYLCKQVRERLGGMALKFVSPGHNGVPDRLILLPDARVYFAETKAPGKTPRRLQRYVIEKIRAFGFAVYCLDSKEKIDAFIREVHWYGV